MTQSTIMCSSVSFAEHEPLMRFGDCTFIACIMVQLPWGSGELLVISTPSTLSTCSNLCFCWINCLTGSAVSTAVLHYWML